MTTSIFNKNLNQFRYCLLVTHYYENKLTTEFWRDPVTFLDRNYIYPYAPRPDPETAEKLLKLYDSKDHSVYRFTGGRHRDYGKPPILLEAEEILLLDDMGRYLITSFQRDTIAVLCGPTHQFSRYFGILDELSNNGMFPESLSYLLLRPGITLTETAIKNIFQVKDKESYIYISYRMIQDNVMIRALPSYRHQLPDFYNYLRYTEPDHEYKYGLDRWRILDTIFPEHPDKVAISVLRIISDAGYSMGRLLLFVDRVEELATDNLMNRLLSPGTLENLQNALGYHTDIPDDIPFPELRQRLSAVRHQIPEIYQEITPYDDRVLALVLVQSLGASILRKWILQDQAICYYYNHDTDGRYYYCTPQRAKHFVAGRCLYCKEGYKMVRNHPIGIGVWHDPRAGSYTTAWNQEHLDFCWECRLFHESYSEVQRELFTIDYYRGYVSSGLAGAVLRILSQETQRVMSKLISLRTQDSSFQGNF